jgi:hypothetical protein
VVESIEPTGVMIIKVWLEAGGLRARLTSTFDVEQEDPRAVNTVGSAAGVQAVMAEWLARFETYHGPTGGSATHS